MSQLRCLVRREAVSATPEEVVRQRLLHTMIEQLGYPPSGIAVEKGLQQMPHLAITPEQLPDRRADIVVFSTDIHPEFGLYPLLLIECKAVKLNKKVVNQVVGYNHYVKAYYVAIANQDEVMVGWQDPLKREYDFIRHLPCYVDLKKSIVHACSHDATCGTLGLE